MGNIKLFAILLALFHSTQAVNGSFYGGSVSYKIERSADSNAIAHIEIVAVWSLGNGPCGPTCNRSDVGRNTSETLSKDLELGHLYFGNFSLTYMNAKNEAINLFINGNISKTLTGTVISVNEYEQWEQERIQFTLTLSTGIKTYIITAKGQYWRTFSWQKENAIIWNLQMKFDTRMRSDTKRPNTSPKLVTQPVYSIQLNSNTTIQLTALDADGDEVKCSLLVGAELGPLHAQKISGIRVTNQCDVIIDARESIYITDDTWMVIPIKVKDYNTKLITYGNSTLNAYGLELGWTYTQFLVHVRKNVANPEFVEPTYMNNHVFQFYVNTNWRTKVYAKAQGNKNIIQIDATGNNQYQMSELKTDIVRPDVKYVEIEWTPQATDVGRHAFCLTAVDSVGEDIQRCFILIVLAEVFTFSQTASEHNMPYFKYLPSPGTSVKCKEGDTCLIPIYVKSDIDIQDIEITKSFVEKSSISNARNVVHNCEQLYQADLSFETNNGAANICLTAFNSNRTSSDTVCLQTQLQMPDPCVSKPCNGHTCTMNEDTGTFYCDCAPSYTGRFCETKTNNCNSNPCLHGSCKDHGTRYVCSCTTGYTSTHEGDSCDINIDDCQTKNGIAACGNGGVCVDGENNFTCICSSRFNGEFCEKDLCPNETSSSLSCLVAGCSSDPCNGNGICHTGGICKCRIGYSGDHCNNITATESTTNAVQFVPPTMTDASTLTCYYGSNISEHCLVQVFVSTRNGTKPVLAIEKDIGDLTDSTIGQVQQFTALFRNNNIFHATITIDRNINATVKKHICVSANSDGVATRLCLEVSFISKRNSSSDMPSHDIIEFVAPTPQAMSRFVCELNQTCRTLLYTSRKDKCANVVSTSDDVTVFPAISYDATNSCITEVSFTFNKEEEKDMCFKSSKDDYQTRCFRVGVYSSSSDPCKHVSCQNEGQCFYNGKIGVCVCHHGYSEARCEMGPCLKKNDICEHGSICLTNNNTHTCACPVGFAGLKCETVVPDSIKDAEIHGANLTDTATLMKVFCVRNKPCTIPLIVSGIFPPGTKPNVQVGYRSPYLEVVELETVERLVPHGSYQTNVQLISKTAGVYGICVQTLDKNNLNKDEVCFKINVQTDVSILYGQTNKPHFVDPSMPANAQIQCVENQPCHVLYRVIPGEGHEQECVTIDVRATGFKFEQVHVFSNCCHNETMKQNGCPVELSILPKRGDINKTICLTLGLKSTPQGLGEERCVFVTVTSLPSYKGCQTVQCENGGFCDGHTGQAVCFCHKGFIGNKCNQTVASNSDKMSQTFFGDLGIPYQVKCAVGTTCPIPFQITATHSITPDVTTGFLDHELSIATPVMQVSSDVSTAHHTGYVNVNPKTNGSFKACIQLKHNCIIQEEICVNISTVDSNAMETETKPHFLDPTLPKDSTVLCKINSSCHIDMHFTTGDKFGAPGKCPRLTSTYTEDDIHIFAPELRIACVADVSYLPHTREQKRLCVQVSLPGQKGEERCFYLKAVDNITKEVAGHCKDYCCNHGRCVAHWSTSQPMPLCTCSYGFSGSNCSDVDECYSHPCKNGGKCIAGKNSHTCTCETGFTGVKCEIDIDECSSNPCHNGKTCLDNVNGYTCDCRAGYTGTDCHTNINECLSNPCKNGGSCTDGVNAFTCNCTPEYTGTNCETKKNSNAQTRTQSPAISDKEPVKDAKSEAATLHVSSLGIGVYIFMKLLIVNVHMILN